MQYSKMAEAIPASSIRAMMARAAEMEDVISFSIGEPDFPPPDGVIAAAKAALDRRDTKYAPGAGLMDLRKAYSAYLSKTLGSAYGPEHVIVTAGGMAALFLGLMSILEPEDEVLVSAPYFSNYAQIIAMCRGKTVPVEVYEADEFVLTPEAVERAITARTKVLILNSPCNPTGGVMEKAALERLAEIAKQHDLWVISDEVYRHILFDGAEFQSIAALPGMGERTLVVDSCSKTFSMTGFRVGFGAGPKHLIDLMAKLTEGVYASCVTVSQRAAIEALRTGFADCERMRREYQRRRDYMVEALNQIPGISCIWPKGAFYLFANISGTGMEAEEFAERLLEEAHVALVPGDSFGSQEGRHYVRISYAASMERLQEGVRRIRGFCEKYCG